jgi:hypothetical protein
MGVSCNSPKYRTENRTLIETRPSLPQPPPHAPPQDRAASGEGPDDEYLGGGSQHGRIRRAPAGPCRDARLQVSFCN